MGVDAVPKPLRRARERVRAAGVDVHLLQGDVTKLTELELSPPFSLLYDRGCFHGLNDAQRATYANGATAVSTPDATLLMMAFARNQVRVGPAGADPEELERLFAADWDVAPAVPDHGPDTGGPLRDVPRHWYRFTRR